MVENFIKYSSLTNLTNAVVEKMVMAGLSRGEFVATEKIHGTHFSAIVTKDGISWARREDVLQPAEEFYQYEEIAQKYASHLRSMFDLLISHDLAKPDSTVQVYGEYAGTHTNGKKIQKQVQYGEADWYIFDIKVDGVYLPPVKTHGVALWADLQYAPILKIGTLEECLAVPNDLQSVVPHMRETNEIVILPGTDNIAEGTVVRNWQEIQYFNNGKLAVIKNKNSKFKGKSDVKVKVSVPALSEADKETLSEAYCYLTLPRLSNVLSHIGKVEARDFGRVSGMFVQDAMKAFSEDTEKEFLEHFENANVSKKTFINHAQTLLRSEWVNILEGDF